MQKKRKVVNNLHIKHTQDLLTKGSYDSYNNEHEYNLFHFTMATSSKGKK